MGLHRSYRGHRHLSLAVALALSMPLGTWARPVPASEGGSPQADAADEVDAPAQAGGQQQPRHSESTAPIDLETVIVTANKRSERLQDVTMAVSAISGSDLERQSAQGFADYASQVPGLNIVSQGAGQTQLTLRGITSGANTPNATVGTYIDDVPYGSSTIYSVGSVLTPDIDPDDLERIEVLRGPQGTLYGANTLGGLIKFVTVKPDATAVAGRVSLGSSSVADGGDGFSAHAMLNLPLARDTLALRVNAYHRHDPGYIDNVATGKKDVNDAKVRGGRAQLLWTPSDAFSLRLSALAQNLDGDALANGGVDVDAVTLKPLHGGLTQRRAPGTGNLGLRYRLYDASINADFGWSQFVSVTSYGTLDRQMDSDVTAAYGPLLNPALGLDNGGYAVGNPVTLGKFTQELRLQSRQDQALEWRTGVFYTRERTTNVQDVLSFDASTGEPIALPFTLGHLEVGPATFVEWAGYGDITWHATPRLGIQLGVRVTHDRTSFTQTTTGILAGDTDFTIKGSDSPTTFLLNPSFKFSDHLMGYMRVASGYRPGGPNVGVPPGLGAPETFGPDKLVSYELGLKSALLDKRMTLDVAGFYIDWNQIQLSSFAGGFSFLGNGGKARSQGVEANWQYAAAPGLVLSANATWTDAELLADTPSGLYGNKGDPLPWVPKWNAQVGFDYDFLLGGGWLGFVGGSYRHVGQRKTDFQTEPGPRFDAPSYNGIDLRAGVNIVDWTFKVYVKNLTDKRGISALASETTVPSDNPFGAVYVMPRTVGLSASVNF